MTDQEFSRIGHEYQIFQAHLGEHIVSVTPWRDYLVIATTDRVLLYGSEGTFQTFCAPFYAR